MLYRTMHERPKAGLEGMGLRYVVEDSVRLPQLHSIRVPEGAEGLSVMIGAG